VTHTKKTRRSQLEKEGWTMQFTIEAQRVEEYVDLYKSLGHEVRVEPVIPSEMGECHVCYAAECDKYRALFTRTKQKEV